MRYLRLMVIAFAFFAASGIAGASWAQAQEFHVYPPTGPCDGLSEGISFWFDGDADVPGYMACDITGFTDLGGYVPYCPLADMTFDLGVGGCFFTESLPDGGTTGGHQPWRDGPRGHCDGWMDGYACGLWQEGYNFPDENGNCEQGEVLIMGDLSGLGVATCQVFSDEDTAGGEVSSSDEPADNSNSDVVISGNGSGITTLPATGSGPGSTIHDESGLIYFLAAICVLTTLSGCAFRRGLRRS